jgi:hypothetical protein
MVVVFIPEVMRMLLRAQVLHLMPYLRLVGVAVVGKIHLELLAVLEVVGVVELMHQMNKPQVLELLDKVMRVPQVFKIVAGVAAEVQVRQVV